MCLKTCLICCLGLVFSHNSVLFSQQTMTHTSSFSGTHEYERVGYHLHTAGDVNDDGSVNIIDALLISQYYVGLNPANFNPANADTNCNGSIDIVDALLVAQIYVGLSPSGWCG